MSHAFSITHSFTDHLRQLLCGAAGQERIVRSPPIEDLDTVPVPSFTEYYEQLKAFLPDSQFLISGDVWIPYESSRGCWWGEKNQCTFCGCNGETIRYRQKSPDKVLGELKTLAKSHPSNLVCMLDNIMPYKYFHSVLPRLAKEVPGLHIFYEQKANLTFSRMRALRDAGIRVTQPGIESLSTSLLRLMRKGVNATQNVNLLRYARSVGIYVNWNLLHSLPGDSEKQYLATLELMRHIRHLNPPTGLSHLSIDRFSPYFESPQEYGIRAITPLPAYELAFPKGAPLSRLAYHFDGEYDSACRRHPDLVRQLGDEVEKWRNSWARQDSGPPTLSLAQAGDDVFLLLDTRGLSNTREVRFVDGDTAEVLLLGPPDGDFVLPDWMHEARVMMNLDTSVQSLVTTESDTWLAIERRRRERRPQRV